MKQARDLVLETRSTDDGEEFWIIGRGDTVGTMSWRTALHELHARLTLAEQIELDARPNLTAANLVTSRTWDAMRGYGDDGGAADDGLPTTPPAAATPTERLAVANVKGPKSIMADSLIDELVDRVLAGEWVTHVVADHWQTWGFKTAASAAQSLRQKIALRRRQAEAQENATDDTPLGRLVAGPDRVAETEVVEA